MRLGELLQHVSVRDGIWDPELNITGIAYDSRSVRAGMLFVCIEGLVTDGHLYATQAVEQGAAAVLAARPLALSGVPVLLVEDTRAALAAVSAVMYRDPCGRLALAGVTGTSGKTSISFLLHGILSAAGQSPGLIGPVANIVGGMTSFSLRETPESTDLMALLDEMSTAGSRSAVLEVSSQGLEMRRVDSCRFAVGIFSNLFSNFVRVKNPPTTERALDTKTEFAHRCGHVVLRRDAPYAAEFLERLDRPVTTYAADGDAEVRAVDPHLWEDGARIGTRFRLETPWFSGPVQFGLPTAYQLSNALGAVAAAARLGCGLQDVTTALSQARVPGCMEPVGETGRRVFVDSARTPGEIDRMLRALRPHVSGHLICLFGCDGRTSGPVRAATGSVVSRLADEAVIAPDNPYDEEPARIAEDIRGGWTPGRTPPVIYNDREAAVQYVLNRLRPEDAAVLTGRGHRVYQMYQARTVVQRDADVVRRLLGRTVPERGIWTP